jgi:hypothetical protein
MVAPSIPPERLVIVVARLATFPVNAHRRRLTEMEPRLEHRRRLLQLPLQQSKLLKDAIINMRR